MTNIIRNSPLHHQVRNALIEMVKKKSFPDNKLNSEEELAEILGVSRATVREALHNMKNQGVITKRHGKGNYVHLSALETKMRIDIHHDFFKLIANGGYEASLEQSEVQISLANELAQKRMELHKEEEVIAFTRVYFANNDPAILVKVQIPKQFFDNELIDIIPEKNLITFMMKYCNMDIAQSIDWLKGATDRQVAELFSISEVTPMLAWDQVYYGIHDEKVCFNEIFFNPKYMDLAVLVKM